MVHYAAAARIKPPGREAFAERTGTAAPKALNPAAAYGSWRLP